MIALALVLALAGTPAAQVGSERISIEDVDRATEGRAEALREQIWAALESAAWRAVDRRLNVDPPALRPATEAEIAARRGGVPPSFPETQRDDALRWIIEREHRAEDGAAERASARGEANAWVKLPADRDPMVPLSDEQIVAGAGKARVLGAEVENAGAVRLFRLRGELHRERARRLEELIDARLLEQEATRRGTTTAALVKLPPPTDAEIAAHRDAAVAAGRPRPDLEVARSRLVSGERFAAREQLLGRLRKETRVAVRLEAPPRPRVDARSPGAPALGPEADVDGTIVVFGTYGDRRTRAVLAEIETIRRHRPDVRVEVRSWIPGFDPAAWDSARLALCGARAGAFDAFHAHFLARSLEEPEASWLSDETLAALSAGTGLDASALRECAGDPALDERIRADADAARGFGFARVPALLVGGFPLSGMQSARTIARVLDGGAPAVD